MMLRHIAEGTDDQSWQASANCLGVDPDLFFPERGASTREAKEVCRGCVVREDCLEYALANGGASGASGRRRPAASSAPEPAPFAHGGAAGRPSRPPG